MSDITLDFPSGPADGGQAGMVEGTSAGQDAPLLPFDEFKGHRVPIVVDGQEQFVPLDEVRQGYQRQADYTRKTQEVAAERQRLQVASALNSALEQDPAGTLRALAGHYGVDFAPAPQAQRQQEPWDNPWQETLQQETPSGDPRLGQLEQRIASFEQREQQQRLEQEIGRLSKTYGESFNPTEVLSAALQMGNPNLEQVYKLVDYDRRAAQTAQVQQAQAKTAQATAAKKAASDVSGGRSVSASTQDEGPILSIRDAWAAAKRELGVS